MVDIKKPELLAPAGNLTCALAAFDAGADAVYAGLSRFNARERTENFSTEEMGKLIAYAHRHGKKVYLTLNTLVKEAELKDVVEMVAEVAYLRPDAVIIQDLGILYILRNYFPELVIHASTQMGIHNSAGVNVAASIGAERVILERQVTVDELEVLLGKTSLEVEVFVHGALCCSLSGVCTFSSWLGGWSGNRGKCKQPCRRRYFFEKGNGFFFSPQDLYTLDLIPRFKKMGVASLKIEGRLKKPDYITHVVKAYRMMIDCEEDSKIGETLKAARAELANASGRKWSSGFYTEKSLKSLINYTQLGVAGNLCGEVVRTNEKAFEVNISRRLHIGDRIRIQPKSGDEGPALTITKMFVDNKSVKKAVKGDRCVIPYDRSENIFGGHVYKIGVATDSMESRISSLPSFKPVIDLDVKVYANELQVSVKGQFSVWKERVVFERAASRPCDEESFVRGFKATGDSSFTLGQCKVCFNGEYFVPGSILKQLRKAFWGWLENELCPDDVRIGQSDLMKFYDDYKQFDFDEDAEINIYNPEFKRSEDVYFAKPESRLPHKKVDVARSIFSYDKKTAEVVLPFFCAEDRIEKLREHVHRAYDDGIRRFRVTSLFQFDLLKAFTNITICVSHPFPVTNSQGVKVLEELGSSKVQAWVELDKESIDRLVTASSLRVEIYRYGRVPLLVTRAEIPFEGKMSDSRKNQFVVIKDKFTKLNYLFAKEAVIIPRVNNSDNFYDLTNASWGAKDVSSFNFEKDFV